MSNPSSFAMYSEECSRKSASSLEPNRESKGDINLNDDAHQRNENIPTDFTSDNEECCDDEISQSESTQTENGSDRRDIWKLAQKYPAINVENCPRFGTDLNEYLPYSLYGDHHVHASQADSKKLAGLCPFLKHHSVFKNEETSLCESDNEALPEVLGGLIEIIDDFSDNYKEIKEKQLEVQRYKAKAYSARTITIFASTLLLSIAIVITPYIIFPYII